MATPANPLADVKAFVFDVFGTVVDWRGSVSAELRAQTHWGLSEKDSDSFALEWRQGYYETTRRVAQGGEGPGNVDVMHREILDAMLASPRWKHLAPLWDDEKRHELVLIWHRLNAWPDSNLGLYLLKKKAIIGTLSNGNVRLLVDMAKHADLPWDVIFAGDILGSYKPNPKMYLSAMRHLDVRPEQCAMVAAHIHDLRAAASHGLKTVYVRRATEDAPEVRAAVRSKAEGGEVDVVVNSFLELTALIG